MLLDGKQWDLIHDDCITHMWEMPKACVDFSTFSPPFPQLYSYSSEAGDLGNSENMKTDAKIHFSFFFRALRRVMKPGRVVIVHCTQIPKMKRTGEEGTHDFRGLLIRLGERAGFVYEYDWCIRRNPQSQAIRTKSRALQFSGLESDRATSRGAMLDYLIKFRAPGDNAVPIRDKEPILNEDEENIGERVKNDVQVTRNTWIDWAEGCWTDINETDTLNVKGTKGEEDTKHICPLALGIIERVVTLYTNPGEIVFSPFAGIGSEGYVSLGGVSPKTKRSIKEPRRFYGIELKDEYFREAKANLARACREHVAETKTLFDMAACKEEF